MYGVAKMVMVQREGADAGMKEGRVSYNKMLIRCKPSPQIFTVKKSLE